MSGPALLHCFAVSAPGLAPFTATELAALGVQEVQAEAGGVAFAGDVAALYRANLHLRTANRVLVRLGEFEAIGFTELRRRAARLPWERCLRRGQAVALRVTCTKSRLYHSDAVAERVAAAIGDHVGRPPTVLPFDEEADPEQPGAPGSGALGRGAPGQATPQLVVVRLLHDRCTISVDSSGPLLHRRGYRLAGAKAPLRETLAAGLLFASGWAEAAQGDAPPPLVDPFCGSGTLPIEAALLACGIAPGAERSFACLGWPGFDAALWQAQVAAALAQRQVRTAAVAGRLHLAGGDRDAGAIAAARDNAARAGVAEQLEFACRAVSATEFPPAPGWVVANPPYGLRVGAAKDLRGLYAQFGKTLRARAPGWRFAVLSADRGLLGQLGLPITQRFSLVNGGVSVTLAVGHVL